MSENLASQRRFPRWKGAEYYRNEVNVSRGLPAPEARLKNAVSAQFEGSDTERLRAAVSFSQKSQATIAADAGISKVYLTLLLQEKKRVTTNLKIKLAKALGYEDSRRIWP